MVRRFWILFTGGRAIFLPYSDGSTIPMAKGVSLIPVYVYSRFTEDTLFCNKKKIYIFIQYILSEQDKFNTLRRYIQYFSG
jgi:hypothetical protein